MKGYRSRTLSFFSLGGLGSWDLGSCFGFWI